MTKPIEEILAPKPEARPRLYAYSIADDAHRGPLKIGQTPAITNYRIELDEPAERMVVTSGHSEAASLGARLSCAASPQGRLWG